MRFKVIEIGHESRSSRNERECGTSGGVWWSVLGKGTVVTFCPCDRVCCDGSLGANAFAAGRANWRRESRGDRVCCGACELEEGVSGRPRLLRGVPIGGGSRGDRVCC